MSTSYEQVKVYLKTKKNENKRCYYLNYNADIQKKELILIDGGCLHLILPNLKHIFVPYGVQDISTEYVTKNKKDKNAISKIKIIFKSKEGIETCLRDLYLVLSFSDIFLTFLMTSIFSTSGSNSIT